MFNILLNDKGYYLDSLHTSRRNVWLPIEHTDILCSSQIIIIINRGCKHVDIIPFIAAQILRPIIRRHKYHLINWAPLIIDYIAHKSHQSAYNCLLWCLSVLWVRHGPCTYATFTVSMHTPAKKSRYSSGSQTHTEALSAVEWEA